VRLAEFREQHSVRSHKIDGREWLYFDSEDRAPPDASVLVMIPGAFGAAEIFWNQIITVGDRLRIVSVTLPAIDNIADIVEGIAKFMDRLNVPSAHMLGSSLGGYVVQVFASRYPHRLNQIFIGNSLLDAYGLAKPPTPELVARMSGIELRQQIIATINAWPESDPTQEKLKPLLQDHAQRCLTDDMIKTRAVILHNLPEAPAIKDYHHRAVIIQCDDDAMLSEACNARVRQEFINAKLHRFATGGHFPYITRSDDYSSIIVDRLFS